MNQNIKIDIAPARSSAVTAKHGITPGELKELETKVSDAHRYLQKERLDKKYGFYDLYKDKDMLREVRKTAKHFQSFQYENLVVLGIGGSALGITTLCSALKPPYYNLLEKKQRGGTPRLFVMDNIDPDTFNQMLALCPPENTLYNVISKSGGTAETITQSLIVLDALKKSVGAAKLKDHLVITTGPRKPRAKLNPLQALIKQYKLANFIIPPNVGGRFSVFTPVGLFPAAVLGINIEELAAGCRAMDKRTSRNSLKDNPAYMRAAIHHLLCTRKAKTLSVMMPYSDKLGDVSDWYRQIWAESLGKQHNLDGSDASWYAGQTPIKALGVTDQHSQLQLYLEGPNDKLITVLEESSFNSTLSIPAIPKGMSGLNYLKGQSMNALMVAERRATVDALRETDRPVIRVTLPEVNEYTLAQLLYMLEVETAMAGRLFNVNAFNQPAVEQIKIFTRQYMVKKRDK